MQQLDVLTIRVRWNYRNIGMLVLFIVLPNVLGMLNIATPLGFHLHCFQLAIFLAAAGYGPSGGMLSGAVGSLYSAVVMSNPWIIAGNAMLGFFTGFFLRRGFPMILAVWFSFGVQLVWIVLTDYLLVGISLSVIGNLVITLFLSHTLWAIVAYYTAKPLKKWIA